MSVCVLSVLRQLLQTAHCYMSYVEIERVWLDSDPAKLYQGLLVLVVRISKISLWYKGCSVNGHATTSCNCSTNKGPSKICVGAFTVTVKIKGWAWHVKLSTKRCNGYNRAVPYAFALLAWYIVHFYGCRNELEFLQTSSKALITQPNTVQKPWHASINAIKHLSWRAVTKMRTEQLHCNDSNHCTQNNVTSIAL